MAKTSSKTKEALRMVIVEASGKALGRVSSEIAFILQGKDLPSYLPYKDGGTTVHVNNFKEMTFSGKKMTDKLYHHFSGYPGGIRTRSLKELWAKDPADVLRRSVYGMLPKNKLRDIQIKRIVFVENKDKKV